MSTYMEEQPYTPMMAEQEQPSVPPVQTAQLYATQSEQAGYKLEFVDKALKCRDCGQDFVFTVGEQEFYQAKGLTNLPGRCPNCRAAKRNGMQGKAPRIQHEAICAECGKVTTVPFQPREDRPVYCSDCFETKRNQERRPSNNW